MSYRDLLNADQRQLILRTLEEDHDYSHNEHILRAALESMGHGVSRDKVRTEVSWLAEQGLVTVEDVSGTWVVKLTARGQDIALGRARVHGVARPRLD